MDDFIKVRQATEISGLDKQMIFHHYRKGRFPAQCFGSVLAISRTGFEAFLNAEYLHSDNGPEFIAKAIQDWTNEQRIGGIYITPGSPWEQAHVESFHDKLRDGCLNRELFGSLAEARVILEQWRVEYNQLRPHSSLGYRTPEEFAARHNPKWGVSKDLNNPKRLFTTDPVRADRFWKAVSPAPVDILRTTP
jgi:hypothetical protein